MTIADEIKKIIEGDILADDLSLEKYSQDASIFKIKPQIIVFPKNTADIQSLIKFVNSHPNLNLSITPRSAGTCMSGGAINDSIILDMTKYFNRIIKVGEDSAIVQPGVYYRDFEKATLEKGLILPCYTASRDINTVGGMVGNNSAGEKTLSYGQTEKWVKRLKIVLADGNEYEIVPLTKEQMDKKIAQKNFEGKLYRNISDLIAENMQLIKSAEPQVSKNSTGYLIWKAWDEKTGLFDLNKIIVGSQGTLGIVTEIEFSLIKHKPHSNLLVIYLYSLDNLPQVINKVLEHKPESFESYDDYTLKFAMKFLPEVIKIINPANMLLLLIKFIPEMWMNLTGGFPKLILLAEFTADTKEEVFLKCKKAEDDLKQFKLKSRITGSEEEAQKYWTIRRQSFSLLRHHSEHMRTAPFIDDIIVKPDSLPQFLPELRAILDHYDNKLIYTIAGHIGNGNFHIIPLIDMTDPETRSLIPEVSNKVFSLVFKYKGSMSAEHNDGLVRGAYLPMMYGEQVYQLFKDVKKIFDPKNIFNPHKKTDATMDYSMKHLSPN